MASWGTALIGPLPQATHARKQRRSPMRLHMASVRAQASLAGRLPDDADNSASLCSYVVQLVPESHRLIADRMDSVYPPLGSRDSYHGLPRFEFEPSHGRAKTDVVAGSV